MGPETSEVYVNGTFLWVYIFFDKLLYSKPLIHFTLIFFYKRVMFILICVFSTDNATIHQSGSWQYNSPLRGYDNFFATL